MEKEKAYRVLARYPQGSKAAGQEAKCKFFGKEEDALKMIKRLQYFTNLTVTLYVK